MKGKSLPALEKADAGLSKPPNVEQPFFDALAAIPFPQKPIDFMLGEIFNKLSALPNYCLEKSQRQPLIIDACEATRGQRKRGVPLGHLWDIATRLPSTKSAVKSSECLV